MVIKEHFQRWARSHFSEKLLNEGFVSYRNEDLSWYKVVNDEVLLTVYLHATFSMVADGTIGYGIHPLFIEAPIPQKVLVSGWVNNEVMIKLHPAHPSSLFNQETYVMCPNTPERGAEYLDNTLFPLFSTIHSIEDCYAFHKQRWLQTEKELAHGQTSADLQFATNDFIDMAIFVDDKEMYPRCMNDLELRKNSLKTKEQARMKLQRLAIEAGQRKQYLEVLEKRRSIFARKLNRKLGISIK